jgi:hypothetical protein
MAKKGGGGGWALLGFGSAVILLAYLTSGRGEENSPIIPDSLEDKIDLVVDRLNKKFGSQWVTFGLDVLQAHLQRTVPQAAWLVNAVYSAEQAYGYIQKAGATKKQAALQSARMAEAFRVRIPQHRL